MKMTRVKHICIERTQQILILGEIFIRCVLGLSQSFQLNYKMLYRAMNPVATLKLTVYMHCIYIYKRFGLLV